MRCRISICNPSRVGELYGSGNIQYVYIFSAIAACILFIAIINFMNLATARSTNRAREVGMRKVMGSQKGALVAQFITESVLTCAAAMLFAVAITVAIFPFFNELTGKTTRPFHSVDAARSLQRWLS